MGINNFFSKNPVIKHLIYILATSFAIVLITMYILRIYTMHGKVIDVPDFTGKSIDLLDKFSSNHKLKYIIIDSIYDFKKVKGTVANQIPAAGSKVKENRTIYLTVIANSPEQIQVPDLKDLSLRQAISILETYGLVPGKIEYINSEFKNAVLEQKYKDKPITPDFTVKVGSAIDLVLGDGIKPSIENDSINIDSIGNIE